MYGDSGSKVLLLAAVEDRAYSYAYGGAGGGFYRSNNGGGSSKGGWVDHVEVEVLPGRGFQFTQSCHLLVLAETKRLAEEWIFDLQVRMNTHTYAYVRVLRDTFIPVHLFLLLPRRVVLAS